MQSEADSSSSRQLRLRRPRNAEQFFARAQQAQEQSQRRLPSPERIGSILDSIPLDPTSDGFALYVSRTIALSCMLMLISVATLVLLALVYHRIGALSNGPALPGVVASSIGAQSVVGVDSANSVSAVAAKIFACGSTVNATGRWTVRGAFDCSEIIVDTGGVVELVFAADAAFASPVDIIVRDAESLSIINATNAGSLHVARGAMRRRGGVMLERFSGASVDIAGPLLYVDIGRGCSVS